MSGRGGGRVAATTRIFFERWLLAHVLPKLGGVLSKPAAPAHLLTIARWAVRQSVMLARGTGMLLFWAYGAEASASAFVPAREAGGYA